MVTIPGGQALHIEHTGSTTVPGSAAKPIIDTVLVVADPSNELGYLPALEHVQAIRLGYMSRLDA